VATDHGLWGFDSLREHRSRGLTDKARVSETRYSSSSLDESTKRARCSSGTSTRFLNGQLQVRILSCAPQGQAAVASWAHNPTSKDTARFKSSPLQSLAPSEGSPLHTRANWVQLPGERRGVVHRVVMAVLQTACAWVRVPDALQKLGWRNGRRAGLRCQWPRGREGSTPSSSTTLLRWRNW
jgi:hypothetical protein